MAKNTTKSINEGKKITNAELETQLKKAAESFGKEPTVEVSVPKNFQKYIGETLPIRINGVGIVLPVDGTKHKIPQSFSEHLSDYLNNLTV